ncbi:hypothetical protein CCACVL1_30732, partial [Corchorus capsularis]
APLVFYKYGSSWMNAAKDDEIRS